MARWAGITVMRYAKEAPLASLSKTVKGKIAGSDGDAAAKQIADLTRELGEVTPDIRI